MLLLEEARFSKDKIEEIIKNYRTCMQLRKLLSESAKC